MNVISNQGNFGEDASSRYTSAKQQSAERKKLRRQHEINDGDPDTPKKVVIKKCGERAKDAFKTAYRKLGLKHFIPLFVVAVYTLLGGLMFQWLEYDHDVVLRDARLEVWHQEKQRLIDNLSMGTSERVRRREQQIFSQVLGRMKEISKEADKSEKLKNDMNEALYWYSDQMHTLHQNMLLSKRSLPTLAAWVPDDSTVYEFVKLDDKKAKNKTGMGKRKPRQLEVKGLQATASTVVADDKMSSINAKRIEAELEIYEERMGWRVRRESIWDIWNSMYFAATLYTTIGYGNVACETGSGRVITCIYALIGIPIVLSAMNDLGKWLFNSLQSCTHYGNKLYDCVRSGVTAIAASPPVITRKQRSVDVEQPRAVFTLDVHRKASSGIPSFKLTNETTSSTPNLTRKMPLSEITATSLPAHHLHSSRSEQLPPTATCSDTLEGSDDIKLTRPPTIVDMTHMDEVKSTQSDHSTHSYMSDDENAPAKIPVLLAVSVTVGWIFVCAGLFCIWEDWSYSQSIYFFVISLSTIGLGDVVPERTDLMVGCMLFIIVGLSLVSMMINVIQQSLEDLYMKLLMKILMEYQKKLAASGGDQVDATMGMMNAWNNNAAAKYLMPLLGTNSKANMVGKFQEKAKKEGIELPPIFNDIDRTTGLPSVLNVNKGDDQKNMEDIRKEVEDRVQQAELDAPHKASAVELTPSITAMPPILYDADTQTDVVVSMDEIEQTLSVEMLDNEMQTENSMATTTDEYVQTTWFTPMDAEAQTTPADVNIVPTQTEMLVLAEGDTQTDTITMTEKELQTHLYDLAEIDQQTDELETHNMRTQTPSAEFSEVDIQTDPWYPSRGPTPEAEEPETLAWDPIDGMHAEKQRAVSDLKSMFGGTSKLSTSESFKRPQLKSSSDRPRRNSDQAQNKITDYRAHLKKTGLDLVEEEGKSSKEAPARMKDERKPAKLLKPSEVKKSGFDRRTSGH